MERTASASAAFADAVRHPPAAVADAVWAVAIHEASHAVVAQMLRVRHGHVSMRPSGIHGGYVRLLDPRKGLMIPSERSVRRQALAEIAVLLAPHLVAQLRHGESVSVSEAGTVKDWADAHDIASEVFSNAEYQESISASLDLAERVLAAGGPAVVRVAEALSLAPTRSLSAGDVRRLVRATPIRWFGGEHSHVRRWAWRALAPMTSLTVVKGGR